MSTRLFGRQRKEHRNLGMRVEVEVRNSAVSVLLEAEAEEVELKTLIAKAVMLVAEEEAEAVCRDLTAVIVVVV